MYYYHARYYDPVLGRFLQADPYLDGLNRYAYCHNNPIIYTDPTGYANGDPALSDSWCDPEKGNSGNSNGNSGVTQYEGGPAGGGVEPPPVVSAVPPPSLPPGGVTISQDGGGKDDDDTKVMMSSEPHLPDGRVALIAQAATEIAGGGAGFLLSGIFRGTGLALAGRGNVAAGSGYIAASYTAAAFAEALWIDAGKKLQQAFESSGKSDGQSKPNIEQAKDNYLKQKGIDAEELKEEFVGRNGGKYDLFVNKDTGELLIYRKGGIGQGIPTRVFIK